MAFWKLPAGPPGKGCSSLESRATEAPAQIYQLHLKSRPTRTNTLQFPLLQLLHSLCLNY